MAARDKKPAKGAGVGAPPPEAQGSEPTEGQGQGHAQGQPRPKSRLAAPPTAKTKANFKLNMIPAVRRRGRPSKQAKGRGRPQNPPPDAKPSLARLVKRKQLTASTAKKMMLAKKTTAKKAAEPEAEEAPALKKDLEPEPVAESRPSSPKTRKSRASRASLDVVAAAQGDVSGAKSPYSTRSERSDSPLNKTPAKKAPKIGKRKSLKDALLSETVETEKRKRGRTSTDPVDKNGEIASAEEDKKIKRLRSHSKDGSEVSKNSDVSESDPGFCNNLDAKMEIKTEAKDPEPLVEDVQMKDAKAASDSIHRSSSSSAKSDKNSESNGSVQIDKVSDDTLADCENNNKNSEPNESVISASETLENIAQNNPEKLVDKSLILDNMSKTFNEASSSDSSKGIRRSARQRKITVKAKEHEEAILAENALDTDIKPPLKLSKSEDEINTSKLSDSIDMNVSNRLSNHIVEAEDSSPKLSRDIEKHPNKIGKNSVEPEIKVETNIEKTTPLSTIDDKNEDGNEVVKDVAPKLQNADRNSLEKLDESSKENIQSKSMQVPDFGKLIDRLKNFEEQDERNRQEKLKFNSVEKRAVMVTNDVVLIPKSTIDNKALKDKPNSLTIEKIKDKDILNCFENNTAVSIIKNDEIHASYDLPKSVTLIKRTSSSSSRKHSTGSVSRDEDSVTMIDKSLGKEVTLDIRKSIDKGILTIETSKSPQPNALPCTTLQVVPASKVQKSCINLKETPAVIQIVPINSENSNVTEISAAVVSPIAPNTSVDFPNINNPVASSSAQVHDKTNEDVPVVRPPVVFVESPERQKQKEKILGTLGLLTLQAAKEHTLEKEKKKLSFKPNDTYTGTLKTIIKLNRSSPDKKKNRSSLKMTFHKNKNRGRPTSDAYSGDSDSDDGPSYTINKKEFGVSTGFGSGSSDSHMTSGGHRKTHYSNRYNNHELGPQEPLGDAFIDTSGNKETDKKLVIPEKASSFAIHPDRLCQDQCFYCAGKFGLFDTPCHIAQIKSVERQKKILDNEEKLTVDSCLCDACYRHVDKRANCASYRKRVGSGPSAIAPAYGIGDICYVASCNRPAPQTLRRKWLVKMRNSVNKVVQLDLDYAGLHTIPLCDDHYQTVLELMVCGLCKRKLSKSHVRYINEEYHALNPLLKEQGIPVVFKEKPVVCKLCRYYCTLLLRPSKSLMNKQSFITSHHERLLQAHSQVPDQSMVDYLGEQMVDNDQIESSKERKKSKNGKSKSKKDENNILNQASHKNKGNENWKLINHNKQTPSQSKDCEDIESLISTNKILIPNLMTPKIGEVDVTGIPVIEMTEKSNVPITGIIQRNSITGLTQKPKNILKVHNASAINKVSHSQKKLNKNLRRIQKLGQIITQKGEFEETLSNKLPNRDEFTIEPMNDDRINSNCVLRNIVLNDECTIESIPSRSSKNTADINSMKNKWQMSDSFTQVKKNLSVLSKNLANDPNKKRVLNQNDSQFFNPVRRLETNPSISVRELFPGEEEMNLQCSIEFGNIKATTPEGWEKCSSIIQYDNPTKQLWQHLQQPYGNQSSFLRHLILLEKYFRNGDLVLSPNANCSAATYSESVQNRLRAFDNVLINGNLPVVNNVQRPLQVSTTTVTQVEMTEPAKRVDSVAEFRKPIVNIGSGKSLLKSNQITNVDSNKKVVGNMGKTDTSLLVTNQIKLPKNSIISPVNDQSINGPKPLKGMAASLTHLEKLGNQLTPIQIPRPPTPIPKSVSEIKSVSSPFNPESKTSTPKSDTSTLKMKSPSLPPELIAINPQTILPKKSMEKVLKNIQQLAKNSSAVQIQAVPTTSNTTTTVTTSQQKNSKSSVANSKDGKKGKNATKQWRPTLIPITDESKSRSSRDVLHQTADGRKLPSLVKVTQAGKPYHITIEDYNRMCILRREKLQQMQQALKSDQNKSASNKSADENSTITPVAKAQSPVSVEPEKHTPTSQSSNGKPAESSALSVPNSTNISKIDENNDKGVAVLPEMENSSLLMNVALKNITIAPISNTKTSANTNSPQSLLITSAKSVLQVPQIMTQLSPSVSVTAETVMPSDMNNAVTALVPKVVPITSQAIVMPKIPKSLTVIPQSVASAVNKASSPAIAPSSINPPLSVLPIPVTSAVAVSPPEP